MMKDSYFQEFKGPGWPAPKQLEHYFLGPSGQRWPFKGRTDCWGFSAHGADGTEHLQEGKGRVDIRLTLVGNPHFGVLLQYRKYGGGRSLTCYSKRDLGRLREWIRTVDGDLMPIGLFIPYEEAWEGVKEFLENDGALPTSLSWVAGQDVPAYAFPDPADNVAGR